MIQIRALDGNGELLAEEKGEKEAFLCVDRVWQEGDRVEISGARQMKVQMDQSLLPGEVYLPEKRMTWRVPAGEERLGYAPGMFETPRHLISARVLEQEETAALRNLAMNPADLRGETDFYPHVFANVETRNEAGFAARNVIDGIRANHSHGEWPWGSWGIGAREDAWCQLDFGREVLVEEMALTLRADFPHDAYWVSGHVVGSDGVETTFELQKTDQRQIIPLGSRTLRWLRLERMQKSDDPSAFPALSQWEVTGCDPS